MKLNSLFLPLVTLAAVVCALPSPTTMAGDDDLPPTSSAPSSATSSAPSSATSSAGEHMTNAERLKQGLPLMIPRHRTGELSLEARGGPEPTTCGRLYVQASDHSYDGFVSASLDRKGRFTVVPNPELAIEVVYQDHRLMATNSEVGPFIGATFDGHHDRPPMGPGRNNFEGTSGNFAVISATEDTPYGARAQSRGFTSYTENNHGGHEAAIFTLDPQNSEILPTWINTDNSTHLSTFGMPREGLHHPLVISQNIGSYNAKYGGYSARLFCVGTKLPVQIAMPLDQLERQS
jgi:hypothetical protein